MNWKVWERKVIFVMLKSGSKYSGTVKSVDDNDNGTSLINIIDKFGKLVSFDSKQVAKIEEVR